MAKADESQQNDTQRTGAAPRTFSSKDVHKRRTKRGLFARPKAKADSGADANTDANTDADTDSQEAIDSSIAENASAEDALAENDTSEDVSTEEGSVSNSNSNPADAGAHPDDDDTVTEADFPENVEGLFNPDEEAEGEFDEAAEAGLYEESADFDPEYEPEHGSDARPASPKRKTQLKTILKRIFIGIIAVVIVAAVGLCSAFAWDRWGRYDDFTDMQGQWYIAGTTASVEIDGHTIHLTKDISYDYQLDDHAKTLTYSFGPMEGQGRYWFSGDRRFLALTDGESFTGVSTMFEDLAHLCTDIVQGGGATGTQLPRGDGVITLCREPGKLAGLLEDAMARAKKRAAREREQKQRELERKETAAEAAEAAEWAETEDEAADGTVGAEAYDVAGDTYEAADAQESEDEATDEEGGEYGESEEGDYASEDDEDGEDQVYGEEPAEEDDDGE